MSYEDFVARLPVGVRKNIHTASEIEVIKLPLASIGLTDALGGGIAAGRIVLVYGNFSSGKTMLGLQSIGKLQKEGKVCAFFDVEGSFDPNFAEELGVNTSELIVSQARSASKVSNEAVALIENDIDFILIDSISMIMPDAFLDKDDTVKDSEDRKQIGAHSKAIKNVISGITYANRRTAVMLLSQTTTKIEQTYVKQVPHGGNAPLFSASQVIKLNSSATDAKQKKGLVQIGESMVEQPIGRTVEAVVEKNKLGRQNTVASYDIYYAGEQLGIDHYGELVDMSVKYGVIVRSGSWFELDGDKIQGRDELVKRLRNDSEMYSELEKKLKAARNE